MNTCFGGCEWYQDCIAGTCTDQADLEECTTDGDVQCLAFGDMRCRYADSDPTYYCFDPECTCDEDCPGTQTCDVGDTWECRQPCDCTADCPDYWYCALDDDFETVDYCEQEWECYEDEDCDSRYVCDTSTGLTQGLCICTR